MRFTYSGGTPANNSDGESDGQLDALTKDWSLLDGVSELQAAVQTDHSNVSVATDALTVTGVGVDMVDLDHGAAVAAGRCAGSDTASVGIVASGNIKYELVVGQNHYPV